MIIETKYDVGQKVFSVLINDTNDGIRHTVMPSCLDGIIFCTDIQGKGRMLLYLDRLTSLTHREEDIDKQWVFLTKDAAEKWVNKRGS